MRTTLEIDDDVFAFARGQAQREHIAVGEMISRLAREGMHSQNTPRLQSAAPKRKFALLPARDEVITTQHPNPARGAGVHEETLLWVMKLAFKICVPCEHVCDLMSEEGV